MPADPARVALAHQVLAQLGVSLADLHATEAGAMADRSVVVVPSIAEYLPRVIAAAGPGAVRTYGSYWTRMITAWAERPVDTITASDIEALQRQATSNARKRRTSRGGRHAGEHVIAAARAVFNRAVADGLIDPIANPAHRVPKPRRLPSTRRALTDDELDAINRAARTSGNDVVLDALLLRRHTETAARRGGALGLRVMDLDANRSLVRLHEKGGTLRWQPITCTWRSVWPNTPTPVARSCPPTPCCATATGGG
jgi:site-specific recombinase XerD